MIKVASYKYCDTKQLMQVENPVGTYNQRHYVGNPSCCSRWISNKYTNAAATLITVQYIIYSRIKGK